MLPHPTLISAGGDDDDDFSLLFFTCILIIIYFLRDMDFFSVFKLMAIVVALHARHFEVAGWGFLLLLWLLFVAIFCGFLL